jgi:hypothetical protein
MALIAAIVFGLTVSLAVPASAATTTTASARTNVSTPPPSPLIGFITPFALGFHVIEVVAEGIANAVEFIATPPPIAIPAPHIST